MPKKQATSKAKHNEAERSARATSASSHFDHRLEAAQRRIRESVGQADTLEAVREIVTNLLGCEEIGLFTVKNGSSNLLWSFGIDTQRHGTLDSFDQSALKRVLQGEFHVVQMEGEQQADHPPLRVFVPICRNGRTVAVLVMLKLLPQKVGFDQADLNLVKLLSQETGRALFEESANA